MMPTKISYCDEVWNPVSGCTKVSPGCAHCFAEEMARRFPAAHAGTTCEGHIACYRRHDQTAPPCNGCPDYKAIPFSTVVCHPDRLDIPLHWRRPRVVLVPSMGDLFHEDVPFGFVMRVLCRMVECRQHTFLVLTKRPERMRDFWQRWVDLSGEDWEPKLVRGPEATRAAHPSGRGQLFADMLETLGEPPSGCAYPTFDWMEGMIRWPNQYRNIYLGVSVEDQATADERIPILLDTPAAHRWVSVEPMLGPVDLRGWLSGIEQVVVGCESGPKRRPMDSAWTFDIHEQCVAARVPIYVKQTPSTPEGYGKVVRYPPLRGSLAWRSDHDR